MSETAVQRAQARGWRRTYFNVLTIPYWGVHLLAIIGIAITGFSGDHILGGLGLAAAFYVPRMFFVTGGYHRYFSHRSYKTSRWFQFLLALGATTTGQKGPLWWAAHHRIIAIRCPVRGILVNDVWQMQEEISKRGVDLIKFCGEFLLLVTKLPTLVH